MPEHPVIIEHAQAELLRLRAEVASLRTQLEQGRAVGQGAVGGGGLDP
jgi:hypothetical protein